MRMVNRQQVLAAIAHGALRGKQILGRGFVSDERIGGDIPQRIDGAGSSVIAADQAAAFAGRCLPRVLYQLTVMRLQECEHTSGDYLAKAQRGTEATKGTSTASSSWRLCGTLRLCVKSRAANHSLT